VMSFRASHGEPQKVTISRSEKSRVSCILRRRRPVAALNFCSRLSRPTGTINNSNHEVKCDHKRCLFDCIVSKSQGAAHTCAREPLRNDVRFVALEPYALSLFDPRYKLTICSKRRNINRKSFHKWSMISRRNDEEKNTCICHHQSVSRYDGNLFLVTMPENNVTRWLD
jgi:hypothetical protein